MLEQTLELKQAILCESDKYRNFGNLNSREFEERARKIFQNTIYRESARVTSLSEETDYLLIII